MRETTQLTVEGNNWKTYSLAQPLVPPGHFPRNQCAATLVINNIPRRIDKPTCIEVFNEAMRLYQLNNQEFWFINIWLNLNLQWTSRVAERFQLVTPAQLEAISTP